MNLQTGKCLLIMLAACTGPAANAQIPTVSAGEIVRLENFHSEFVTARHVDVWLPEGCNEHNSYTVLYMHDGQMLFDSTITWNQQEWGVDEAATRLIEENKLQPFIVVGIHNSGEGRHADYLPQKPFESLPEDFQQEYFIQANYNSLQSDNYLHFLVEELKPYIDKNFSTKPERENTFVAGSSMGGLISIYAICEHPDVFGGAACISTHWPGIRDQQENPLPGAFMEYLNLNLPSPDDHKIYFDYGTETLDALYEPYQKQADVIMRENGYTDQNWMTRKFEGASHSENAWRARLHTPLLFLMGD
ncbi:MAG: esterase family protein [Bacteroidales bacterium]|nr:esterase family protein [Bacteroidales bacterium]MCF8349838.1 esterase family protein [Bacteroidales bacterium]MCF8375566.1 esterase family protein [Bacteroidales bacterium]